MQNLNVFSSEKSVTQHWLKQYSVDSSLAQMTIGMIRLWLDSYPWFPRPTQLWLDSFESESSQIWLTTHESSTTPHRTEFDGCLRVIIAGHFGKSDIQLLSLTSRHYFRINRNWKSMATLKLLDKQYIKSIWTTTCNEHDNLVASTYLKCHRFKKNSSNVCWGGFAGSEPSLSIACCAGPDPTTRSRNSSAMT